jgi:hypothetical protein
VIRDDRVDARVAHRAEHGESVAVMERPAPARTDDRRRLDRPAPTIGVGRPAPELAPSADGEGSDVASALIAPPIPPRASRPR